MKLLVFSDTHGRINECAEIIKDAGSISGVIHAGDMIADAEDLSCLFENIPFYAVRGNNDFFSSGNDELVVSLGGKKLFIAHGHNYGVKYGTSRLAERAKGLGADIAVFGHTHKCCNVCSGGLQLLNPGTMGYYPRTHGVITIEGNEIKTHIVNYD